MPPELWSYLLSAIGILGFYLAGKRLWYAWYVNLANQFLWTAYALTTDQFGFLIASVFYTAVFAANAHAWTREHRQKG